MKKISILLFFLGLFISCNTDDNSIPPTIAQVDGVWKLIDVSCECIPPNFQTTHTWDFNISENKVTVTNETDEDLQILDNGTYPFVITTSTITIESIEYEYFFQDGKMYIGIEYVADGPLLVFER